MEAHRQVRLLEFLFAIALAAYAYFWFGWPLFLSDALAEWAQIRGLRDGLDPYGDIVQLAATYGLELKAAGAGELGNAAWVHPRTPGSLLLLYPLGFLEAGWARNAYLLLGAFSYWVIVCRLVPKFSTANRGLIILAATLLLISAPVWASFEFATLSLVVAVLVLGAWIQSKPARPWIPGVMLGIAVTLKLWPAILLIPLLIRRQYRIAWWCLGFTIGANGLGALFLGISPGSVIEAMSTSTSRWLHFSANASVAGVLARMGMQEWLAILIPVLLAAGLVVWLSLRHGDLVLPFAITLGVAVSPLSWEHYDVVLLALIPITMGGVAAASMSTWGFLGLAEFGLVVRPYITDELNPSGLRTLTGRTLLTLAFALSIRSASRPKRKKLKEPRGRILIPAGSLDPERE